MVAHAVHGVRLMYESTRCLGVGREAERGVAVEG